MQKIKLTVVSKNKFYVTESIKNTMIYEQVKDCIEKSYSYLSPICRKTILKVMVKNIEELKFAGSFDLSSILLTIFCTLVYNNAL